jgi:phosphoglycolate phosphatase-like HAD superfamily hydrolase
MSNPFVKTKEFFVGIDSDGCAFDTMEVKHKECFIPNIIRFYGLAAVSKYAREAAEFVNLYSKWRGINRFPALLLTCELLRDRAEVKKRRVHVPPLTKVREWTQSESKLSNPALAEAVERTGDEELKHCLAWSKAVNETIAAIVHHVPPFPLVRESLERLSQRADILVVSATPTEALVREWQEHELDGYVAGICGQEVGGKQELLSRTAEYPMENRLMIGDAPGDLAAARANQTAFFPINPAHEDDSWQRFFSEGIDRFFAGSFRGEYENTLIESFESYLPETPSWRRG